MTVFEAEKAIVELMNWLDTLLSKHGGDRSQNQFAVEFERLRKDVPNIHPCPIGEWDLVSAIVYLPDAC